MGDIGQFWGINSVKSIIAVILGVEILLLSLLFSSFVFLNVKSFYRRNTETYGSSKGAEEYRYLTLNRDTGQSSNGFVTIGRKLDSDDFMYFEGDDELHLISNNHQNEYVCRGTCSCDTKRRISSAIVRTVVYLAASVTSLGAYNHARQYFKEECLSKISDKECPRHSVRSAVETCENILELIKEHEKGSEDEDEENDESGIQFIDQDGKLRRADIEKTFHCVGRCSQGFFRQASFGLIGHSLETLEKLHEIGKEQCDKFVLEEDFTTFVPKDYDIDFVERQFTVEKLDFFCVREGKGNIVLFEEFLGEEIDRSLLDVCSLCVGGELNESGTLQAVKTDCTLVSEENIE